MKLFVKILTLILGILAIIATGVKQIAIQHHVSYELLLYDIKSRFVDNASCAEDFYAMVVWIVLVGVVYGLILFGAVHVSCTVKVRKRSFEADFDKKSGVISLKLVANLLCIVIIATSIHKYGECFEINMVQGAKTWKPTKTVGHSFGAINSDSYTGSLEAFLYNYGLGRRTMEVDLLLTTDNRLVLRHDWDEPLQEGISEMQQPTEEVFLNTKILGLYTPLSFSGLCELMMTYPDVWIVTDTKETEKEEIKKQFEVLVDTARQLSCEEVLDRMIVQIYNEEMYETVKEVYDFNNYIFTMYMRFYDDDWLGAATEVCRFCVNNGIETITIGTNRISPQMKAIADRYGRNVYVHTVNDTETAEKYFEMGVIGIYTDSLYDDDL